MGATWLECRVFSKVPWLLHAFGARQGGALGPELSGQGSARKADSALMLRGEKRSRFLQALGAADFSPAAMRQTHSAMIYRVSQRLGCGPLQYQPAGDPSSYDENSPHAPSGDALISDRPGILLTVRTADCMPVLLVDPARRAVAAVHAGWRGALNRIIEKAAGEMCRTFHSRPEDLMAAVGPSIRACCYEVGEEVVDAFCGTFPSGEDFFRRVIATLEESRMALRYQTLFARQAPPGHRAEAALSKLHLDLAAVACYQLEHAGVPRGQIDVADYCTACRTDLFYSYRKEGSLAGRMLAVIGIRR
jgi:purine-nucleoside/S-methyl-5'-thioadenosine phosphorylase / adenosine deaminase